jgi:hypothetical protein
LTKKINFLSFQTKNFYININIKTDTKWEHVVFKTLEEEKQ